MVVVGGGAFVIRGSLKLLQGFRGETTQICSDNAQMLGKHRLRILDLVFNSTGLAFESDLRTTYIFRPRVLLHPIIISTVLHPIIISQQVERLPVHYRK